MGFLFFPGVATHAICFLCKCSCVIPLVVHDCFIESSLSSCWIIIIKYPTESLHSPNFGGRSLEFSQFFWWIPRVSAPRKRPLGRAPSPPSSAAATPQPLRRLRRRRATRWSSPGATRQRDGRWSGRWRSWASWSPKWRHKRLGFFWWNIWLTLWLGDG